MNEILKYGEKRLGVIKENKFLMKKTGGNTGLGAIPVPVSVLCLCS